MSLEHTLAAASCGDRFRPLCPSASNLLNLTSAHSLFLRLPLWQWILVENIWLYPSLSTFFDKHFVTLFLSRSDIWTKITRPQPDHRITTTRRQPEFMDVDLSLQTLVSNPLIAERNPPHIPSMLIIDNTMQVGHAASTILRRRPQLKASMIGNFV